jgi:salicylate hydroxylase
VTYPLAGGMLNIVAVREQTEWVAEGWSHAADPAELRATFADCAAPLRAVLDRVTETRIWGLFRHPVAAHWQDGGIALLGDAAHPTLPFLAQGANLAIEDAWVLASVLDRGLPLKTYQALRRARVERAVAAADANARNYHLGGVRRVVAHAGLRVVGAVAPRAFLRRMDWLYGRDVTRDWGMLLRPAAGVASGG